MIVVDESYADAAFFLTYAGRFRDGAGSPSGAVMQQVNSVALADRRVGLVVVIEITRGTAESAAGKAQSGSSRYIVKASVAGVVQQVRASLCGRADEQQIGFAVGVVIKKAGACAWSGPALDRGFEAFRVEVNGNGRGRLENGVFRKFGGREFSLVAVAGPERRAEVMRSDVLEALQMLAGRVRIAFALIRARQSELRGSVVGKILQRVLKGFDSGVIVLLLGFEVADEVIGVGFARNKLRDAAEGFGGLCGIAQVFVGQ